MPTTRSPRRGTLQFWHRKRAKRIYARVRYWPATKEAKLIGFPGYKVGMTHLMVTDNKATSMTKGQDIFMPATIIECPPIKTVSAVLYKKTPYGLTTSSAIMAQKLDKELARKISMPKSVKKNIEDVKPEDFDDLKILIHTQPGLTTIGKKKPEMFEIALGGKKEEKLVWAKTNLGKEINVSDVFTEGQLIDSHAISKGKGYQGPVKRFGAAVRQHKAEKTKRGPGSLGAWNGSRTWTVPHAGQMGFHQRVEYNKWVIKMGNKPEEVNSKSGFKRYGLVRNNYLLIKGSMQGPAKRMIIMINSIRPDKLIPKEGPSIQFIKQ